MTGRLTAEQRRDRAVSEADLLVQVTDLAAALGWSWVHFRPAQTTHGWRTPVQGPLGVGWPDLVIVRGSRILGVELKRQTGHPTDRQSWVLSLLAGAGVETHVIRPSDLNRAGEILR